VHYEVHDSSGTPLLLLHGGLFDIHQQFGELLPGKLDDPPRRPPETRSSTGLDKTSRPGARMFAPCWINTQVAISGD
jgi:hypothetical protein